MCTFNGRPYIRQQLTSIAAQTLPPAEVVVFDDCSTDDTVDVIERFARTAPFPVRLHVNETTLGVLRNFEQAIAASGGDAIALCDQDDVWLPHKLDRLASCLLANRADIACSNATLIDEGGLAVGFTAFEWAANGRVKELLEGNEALAVLLRDRLVPGAAMLLRSSLRNKALPFPTDLLQSIQLLHDGWLSLVAAGHGGFVVLDEPLFLYRQHDRQQTGMSARRRSGKVVRETPMVNPAEPKERRQHLAAEAAALDALTVELRDRGCAISEPADHWLRARASHLQARAALLSRPRSRRLTGVVTELRRGGYAAHSAGVRSAFRDLISG